MSISNTDNYKKVSLEGKTADIQNLPTDVANGSTFWNFEKQELLTFDSDTKTWI